MLCADLRRVKEKKEKDLVRRKREGGRATGRVSRVGRDSDLLCPAIADALA